MRRHLTVASFLLLLALGANASKPASRHISAKVISRAVDLMGPSGGYIHDIPSSPPRDEPGLARNLAKSMITYRHDRRGKDDPVIVISDDPALAARVARLAFSSLPPSSLRGLKVICIVGKQYDGYLSSVGSATGVRLEVEPLPK